MAQTFGSPEWAAALHDEINASSEYRNAAAGWGTDFNGNVLLGFEADDQLAAPLNLLVRLKGGRCQGAEFVDDPKHDDAGFSLAGPFSLWKSILERKTMAATAILTGRLKVEGDRLALLKHTSANRALVHCAASIETDWS